MRIARLFAIVASAIAVVTAVVQSSRSASAEKSLTSPQGLRDGSTHIVVGEVKAIYSQTSEGVWRTTRYLAEVKAQRVEKGEGIAVGSLLYVRYWSRAWASTGPVPPSTGGHIGLPVEGQILRIYLARNAYDGFTDDNKDGGLNVIGVNGFEVPLPPASTGPAFSGWLPAQGNLKIGVRIYEGESDQK